MQACCCNKGEVLCSTVLRGCSVFCLSLSLDMHFESFFLKKKKKKKKRGGGRKGRKWFNNYAGNYMMLKLYHVLLFQWRDFLQYCALQRL